MLIDKRDPNSNERAYLSVFPDIEGEYYLFSSIDSLIEYIIKRENLFIGRGDPFEGQRGMGYPVPDNAEELKIMMVNKETMRINGCVYGISKPYMVSVNGGAPFISSDYFEISHLEAYDNIDFRIPVNESFFRFTKEIEGEEYTYSNIVDNVN